MPWVVKVIETREFAVLADAEHFLDLIQDCQDLADAVLPEEIGERRTVDVRNFWQDDENREATEAGVWMGP